MRAGSQGEGREGGSIVYLVHNAQNIVLLGAVLSFHLLALRFDTGGSSSPTDVEAPAHEFVCVSEDSKRRN